MNIRRSAGVLLFLLITFVTVRAQEKVALLMPQITLQVGDSRNLEVFIKCLTGTCAAFETTIGFDPTVIEVEAAELGPFLGEQSLVVANTVDNSTGTIMMAATALGDPASTDTTVLMRMQVKALTAGNSALSVRSLVVGDLFGNPMDIAAFDGAITVSSAPVENNVSGTINLLGFANVDRSLEAILPAFKQVYPNVEVLPNLIDFHEAHEQLLNALLTGENVPDLAVVEHSFLQTIVQAGGLENLSASPYNADQYADDFVGWIWELGKSPDGHVVAIPSNIGPGIFFYRRDLFEAAGLPSDPETVAEMTRTWDGFLDVCEKLTDAANNRWCLSTANDIVYTTLHVGRFFDENGQVIVNRPEVVRLVEYAIQARRAGVDAQVGSWSPEWQHLLKTGGIAMHFDGSWLGGSLQTWLKPDDGDWSGKWGVFPVPESPGQNRGGSSLVIPAQAPNKEAAWALMEFMLLNKSSVNAKFIVGEDFPAYIPAYDDPIYAEALPFYGGQHVRMLWRDIAIETDSLYVTPADDEAVDVMGKWLGRMIGGAVTPQQGLAEAALEIQVLLESYNTGVPAAGCTHTVQPGDMLAVIASRYGVTVDSILTANALQSANLIVPGQVLTIPDITC